MSDDEPILASGGWCAPADNDMPAPLSGVFDIPQIGVRRSGLRWPERRYDVRFVPGWFRHWEVYTTGVTSAGNPRVFVASGPMFYGRARRLATALNKMELAIVNA